ncbi:hypothetical protein NW762_007669 [Fusarium torreyae]|uniref:Uncharacterized protein n=1 Tax=Fusarium torreyae TaxID=1237075 RepID=A0A9W8RXH6_9HYPO|nr:hypothetical protein NW762_007669 [Fusarium torreyae]
MGDLFDLLHSLKSSAASHVEGDVTFDKTRSRAYQDRLISLTRFKAVSLAIENQPQDKDSKDVRIHSLLDGTPTKFELAFESLSQLAPEAHERPARSSGLLNNTRA